MNVKFSLLVRRHLLETGDDRPADGQLDTVVLLTAALAQRPSWLVRLRWLVSPAAPYGNSALRYGVFAATLLIATGMIAVVAGGPRPGGVPTAFEGRWTSTDPPDHSTQTLVVGEGQTPSVHFKDDFSVNCELQGDSSTVFFAAGPGEIQQNRLVARFPSGGCLTWQMPPFEWWYDYDSAADTLLDHDGITWRRLP